MYTETLSEITKVALSKKKRLNESIPRYLLSSGLAGAYVGIAITLIIIIGAQLSLASSPYTSIIMGASFGLALTLVIIAGSDLFTGNNMYFTVSTLNASTSIRDTLKDWYWCYIGNFLGAIAVCLIVFGADIFKGIPLDHLLFKLASKKMNLTLSEAFFRGILCNWIVCLAVWMGLRVKSDTAKIIVIYACLFTFIVSGYEHSIANMTVLTLSLILPHPDTISIAGMFHNLLPVTLGNMVGGGLFVGMSYFLVSHKKSKQVQVQEGSQKNQDVKAFN